MKKLIFEKNIHDFICPKTIKLILLKSWTFITVTGKNCYDYLQGQLTYNLSQLKENKHIICSHCSINGKVISNLRLFMHNNGYGYIQRKSVSTVQTLELKKYAIFSHVKICENYNVVLLGIIGILSKEKLFNVFKNLPNKKNSIYYENNVTILYFDKPYERFLIIIEKNNPILNKILELNNNRIYPEKIWLALDIISQFPIIDHQTSKKFFPQSLNLEKLDGIDFNKGCYYGQEMIAKIHFKKLNKYQLYWLSGYSYPAPKIGIGLEFKKHNKFCNCGWILSVVNVSRTKIWLQAILQNENNYIKKFIRIKNNINSFFYTKKNTT